MARLLQVITDKYIAPEHTSAAEVTQAKQLLADYWTSRDATRRDAWARQPDWLKNRPHF